MSAPFAAVRTGVFFGPSVKSVRSVRAVLVYAVLVGTPVLGLFGVLRAGEGLEVPPAVGGVWRIEGGGAACALAPGEAFRVVQSGQYLAVEVPGRARLDGRLVRGVLRAAGGPQPGVSPGCASEPLALVARVAGGVADRLRGTVGVPGCAACPPVAFEAVRADAPADERAR